MSRRTRDPLRGGPITFRSLGGSLARPLAAMLLLAVASPTSAQEPPDTTHEEPEVDPRARLVPHDTSAFGPDPTYDSAAYDFEAQVAIYGDKHLNPTQRPLLELGRDLYQRGPFQPTGSLGGSNRLIPQLFLYGDLRVGGARNDNANPVADPNARIASRLNLEIDFRLTATERFHAFIRPLDDGGDFTRIDFVDDSTVFEDNLDATLDALFFEGDLGQMFGGGFDLPVAGGLMPLLFHNGIWVEEAFTGAAFTLMAKNSASLDWSNFDITFFAGFDRLTNPTFAAAAAGAGEVEQQKTEATDHGRIFGTNWFVEAYRGYLEMGYAYVDDEGGFGNDYHSVALSFTHRYGGWLNNSIRYVGTLGVTPDDAPEDADLLADGHLLLVENAFITGNPYRVVPYLNLFASIDRPLSAARAAGAGGILKNTGINFESDGLTGFPTLDATAFDAVGGALGVNLLGAGFANQLVLEAAVTYPYEDDGRGEQFAFGARIQQPLNNAIILRLDGMYGKRKGLDDISGIRAELRYKF